MLKYPYTILSILLFFLLVGPFILRLIEPRLEIYPAVLFPSGAELLRGQETTREYSSYGIYGIRDSLEQIDLGIFMGKIPNQNFHHLVKGNFGLENYSNPFIFSQFKLKFEEKNYLNDFRIDESKAWLKEKLRQQNFNDSILILRQNKSIFKIKDQELLSKELIYEKSFLLY